MMVMPAPHPACTQFQPWCRHAPGLVTLCLHPLHHCVCAPPSPHPATHHAPLQVLYQLFDWPSQPGSRLAIIGISNTHDLDQRVLPRIASRLDQAKLAFAPYAVAQLVAIVQDRLESSGVAGAVEQAAVEIACRKVAAETGGCC